MAKFELATGIDVPDEAPAIGHGKAVTSLRVSPCGKWIASASFDGTVKLADALTGRVHATLRGHRPFPVGVAFSPDCRTLATVCYRQLKLWNIETHREMLSIDYDPPNIGSVAFTPSGTLLVFHGWRYQEGCLDWRFAPRD
jgi:WD40 repeat protein